MNNVVDLNYCKSGKYNYTTLHCNLCDGDREIYKSDLKKLTNGCNQCNKTVFKQVAESLNFSLLEDYKYYYSRYRAFIRRCFDRNQKGYINYGARGIKVEEIWKGNSSNNLDTHPQAFKNWLIWAFAYGDIVNLSLERIDHDKSYSPSNCEMIPFELQQCNKKNVLNKLKDKSSIYSGVCKNGNHLMVFYWDEIKNKTVTILNKKDLINEEVAADLYDDYLIKNNLKPVNKQIKKTKKVFTYLFDEQDLLNTSINSNWKQEALSFDLYTQVESIEGIQSFNFKHWKKDKNDFINAKMEFTDIVFFVMSSCLKENITPDIFSYLYNVGFQTNTNKLLDVNCIIKLFQDICFYSLSNNLYNVIICLGYLANTLDIDLDTLFSKYISKKCLNVFRQDKGYKEGTYIKQWPSVLDHGTVEDNVHLELILNEPLSLSIIQDCPDELYTHLYTRLTETYPG